MTIIYKFKTLLSSGCCDVLVFTVVIYTRWPKRDKLIAPDYSLNLAGSSGYSSNFLCELPYFTIPLRFVEKHIMHHSLILH